MVSEASYIVWQAASLEEVKSPAQLNRLFEAMCLWLQRAAARLGKRPLRRVSLVFEIETDF